MSIVQKVFSRERGLKSSSIMYPDMTVPRMDFFKLIKHSSEEEEEEEEEDDDDDDDDDDDAGAEEAEEAGAAEQISCIAFTPTGEFLVSGSHFFTLWNMNTFEEETISFQAGTRIRITQVTVMTDETKILFSLSNGEVLVAHINDNGEVGITKLGSHLRAVSGLIRDIGNPNLGYSCGKDGFIKRFDIRCPGLSNLLKCSRSENDPSLNLKLNGILQNPDNPQCITVCGDDACARVYDLRRLKGPKCLYSPHDLAYGSTACIKGIAYSNMGQLLASYDNQKIYMFQQEMGSFPLLISEAQVYQGHTVDDQIDKHDITFFGSKDEYIASGSACGRIFFWNKREPNRVSRIGSDLPPVSCMIRHPHPQLPILATGGVDQLVRLWAPTLLIE